VEVIIICVHVIGQDKDVFDEDNNIIQITKCRVITSWEIGGAIARTISRA
jgi:hypothetical protein